MIGGGAGGFGAKQFLRRLGGWSSGYVRGCLCGFEPLNSRVTQLSRFVASLAEILILRVSVGRLFGERGGFLGRLTVGFGSRKLFVSGPPWLRSAIWRLPVFAPGSSARSPLATSAVLIASAVDLAKASASAASF